MHSAPPFFAFTLYFLFLCWDPPPHVWLQVAQFSHSAHWQSTTKKIVFRISGYFQSLYDIHLQNNPLHETTYLLDKSVCYIGLGQNLNQVFDHTDALHLTQESLSIYVLISFLLHMLQNMRSMQSNSGTHNPLDLLKEVLLHGS